MSRERLWIERDVNVKKQTIGKLELTEYVQLIEMPYQAVLRRDISKIEESEIMTVLSVAE